MYCVTPNEIAPLKKKMANEIEKIKKEYKEKFDLTLNDDQAAVIYKKRNSLPKEVTVTNEMNTRGRRVVTERIGGFRI